jgi:hypothetical protein
MSLVVCEQLGPVMGDQAMSIGQAKNETPEARTFSLFICKICRICKIYNLRNMKYYEYAEYGI